MIRLIGRPVAEWKFCAAQAREGLVSGRRVSSSLADDPAVKVPFARKLLGIRKSATTCRQVVRAVLSPNRNLVLLLPLQK
ncbi:MAG: hypothetical protein JOZ11_14540 [Alphaproteobacteria bacterium]|nr:hypothetical protein [Alphaproteobacteria bacterium]